MSMPLNTDNWSGKIKSKDAPVNTDTWSGTNGTSSQTLEYAYVPPTTNTSLLLATFIACGIVIYYMNKELKLA